MAPLYTWPSLPPTPWPTWSQWKWGPVQGRAGLPAREAGVLAQHPGPNARWPSSMGCLTRTQSSSSCPSSHENPCSGQGEGEARVTASGREEPRPEDIPDPHTGLMSPCSRACGEGGPEVGIMMTSCHFHLLVHSQPPASRPVPGYATAALATQ